MYGIRRTVRHPFPMSDLACERRRADTDTEGVEFREEKENGFLWERVGITSKEGERSIGRPCGHYDTLNLGRMDNLTEEQTDDAKNAAAKELRRMCEAMGVLPMRILTVGLGNASLSPDAVGAKTAAKVRPTMQISMIDPEYFRECECAELAVIAPGVMAQSGMEAFDTVKGVAGRILPDLIIAVDALAARSTARLGSTVQFCDTGIFPGSGIGNGRHELNRECLGVPVIAIGVPTVIDARVFLLEEYEKVNNYLQKDLQIAVKQMDEGMFVSPREIDEIGDKAAEVIAGGINRAFGLIL